MQKVVKLLGSARFIKKRKVFTSLIIVIAAIFCQSAAAQDLNKKITLNVRNGSIKEALNQVRTQSGINFAYNSDINKYASKKVTVVQNNITVKQGIELILAGTTLRYKQVDDQLLIEETPAPKSPNVSAGQRAGSGSIEGTITDQKTKETLIGVTVQLVGANRGSQTDANGKFRIGNIPAGSYQVGVSYIGYQKPKPFYIDIKANENSTINFTLTSDSKELSQVIVVGSRSRATEGGTLDLRKNALNTQDLVSAQQIQATASLNTAQALQKAVGVSITDNRYIAVRGMTDRNVVVQMNGTRLSSANNDRNAVAMDIIPASLLDYVAVEKTITPDKPADATAGLVELHTKTFPDSLTIQISMQSGFNDQVGTGGNITSFENSSLGFWGQNLKNHRLPQDLTDLASYYPGGGNLGSSRDINTKNASSVLNNGNMAYAVLSAPFQQDPAAAKREVLHINQVQEELDPVITTSAKKVVPNQNYALSFGNRYKIAGKDVGVVAGFNYTRNTNMILYGQLNQYSLYSGLGTKGGTFYPNPLTGPDMITPNNIYLTQRYALHENSSQEQISYGGLASVSLRLNRHHDFSINYLVNKGFESNGSAQTGYMPANHNAAVQEYQLRTTSRTLSNFQFIGNHSFGDKLPVTFNWKVGTSHSNQEDPDYRNIATYADVLPASNSLAYNYLPYTLNGRFFRYLTESNNTYQADLSIPFTIKKIKITSKSGGFYFKRNRSYDETFLKLPDLTIYYNRYLPDFNPLLAQNGGNLNLLVSPNVIGTTAPLNLSAPLGQTVTNLGVGPGWFYYPIKTLNNYKDAYQQNSAIYEMLTIEPTKWLKIAGGVRFENTRMHANIDTTGKKYAFDADHVLTGGSSVIGLDSLRSYQANLNYKLQPFPSASVILKVNPLMNVRMAYSKSLGRPELRELIPTAQFDPYQQALVVGNENLINSTSHNADFRWEWFRKEGEVFALSLFYKRISNQLEKTFQYSGEATYSIPLVTYRNNSQTGNVEGIEFEIRKDLGEFTSLLKNITLGGNLMLAKSFTKLSPGDYGVTTAIDRDVQKERPLFDQPNYVLNSYLTYYNKQFGTTVNLYFNSTGQRLTLVNLDGSPNIYQLPVNNLDLIINKKINKRMTLNAYLKNLADSPIRYAYTTENGNGKYGTYNQTYYYRSYHTGREVALGFIYLF